MEEIKYIAEIIKEHGFWTGMGAALLVFFIWMLKSEWIKKLYSKAADMIVESFLKKKHPEAAEKLAAKIKEEDITSHEVFNYIRLWKYARIPTISFSTEYRTAVFRKYLFIYLESYKENLKDFMNSEYESMGPAEIKGAFLEMINKTMYDYERKMAEQGIPKIVIDKMRVKNSDTITLTIDLIEGICSSTFYESENNYLKTYSIFNIIMSILDNTLSNSGRVCDSINGELAGLSFNDGGRIVTEPKKH